MSDTSDVFADDGGMEPGFRLVMPFVVTKSNGGRLDDEAFALGWLCGTISHELKHLPDVVRTYERYVQTAVVDQLDLIGMHHGFTFEHEPWDEDDEWTWAKFTREAS